MARPSIDLLTCASDSPHTPHTMHTQAFFVQMQIRSADEPMTTFYRCTRCANRWSGD